MTLPDKPNIVLIHGHDMGRYLGCYGHRVATPAIDALAAQGLRFSSYFCPAPQCSPSRASMMTGRYPHNNGMLGLAHLDWQLKNPAEALPHLLKRLGYDTYLFGEQHEASSGEVLGYDACHKTGWPQLARHVAPAFAEQLKTFAPGKPFFASIGFFEAHLPFDHPGYEDDDPATVEVLPYLPDTPVVREEIAALNGRVNAVDQGVSTIIEALESQGLRERTLVIFTTDHGLAFPRAKGTLYDAGLEVAFIMNWPGTLAAGEVRQELLCHVDLVPTLLELAGAKPPADLDGRSFLPLLKGEAYPGRDAFMCEMTWHDKYAPVRGLRTERWKYIRHYSTERVMYLPADVRESPVGQEVLRQSSPPRADEELYDLVHDPLERRNLIDDEDHTDVANDLRQRVNQWMQDTDDPLLRSARG